MNELNFYLLCKLTMKEYKKFAPPRKKVLTCVQTTYIGNILRMKVVCYCDRHAASRCFVRKIHKHGIGKELAARALTQTFISFNNQQYCDKNINAALLLLQWLKEGLLKA